MLICQRVDIRLDYSNVTHRPVPSVPLCLSCYKEGHLLRQGLLRVRVYIMRLASRMFTPRPSYAIVLEKVTEVSGCTRSSSKGADLGTRIHCLPFYSQKVRKTLGSPDGQIEAWASAPARYASAVKIGLMWLRDTAHTVESNDTIPTIVISKIAAPTLFTVVVGEWAQAHCDTLQDPGSCLANSYV